ncbi:MAG: hypothetical protein H0W50_10925, partial [Parachlamydiaceae bacterium]|nr:hypothetical protein [Parachlamydiaceae bacterium]
AISELKSTFKKGGNQRLHPLFHSKVVETLLQQPEAPRALGQLSVVNAQAQIEAVEKIFNYQEKFSFPTIFHEEILDASACMTPEQEIQWENFLTLLEKASEADSVTKKQSDDFKQMLKTVRELDFLPLWMTRFFLPEAEKMETQGVSKVVTMLQETMTPATTILLKEMHDITQEMHALRDNLNLFSDPATFDKVWKQLMELHAKLACTDETLKTRLNEVSPLGRIATYQVMGSFVDLYDSSIKSMKASTSFTSTKKVELFTQMLTPYFELLKGWTTQLSGNLLQYQSNWPLDKYLKELKSRLDATGNEINQLNPSRWFRVYSAILGSTTAFDRALPDTKEDVFTLIHQNLLTSMNALLGSEMNGKTKLPSIIEQASKIAETTSNLSVGKYFIEADGVGQSESLIQLVGYSFPLNQIILHYNYPLRNHSATFALIFDKPTQTCSLDVKFLGEARTRFSDMSCALQFLSSIQHIKLLEVPQINNMELSYSLKLVDSEDILNAFTELKKQAVFTLVEVETDAFYDKFLMWVTEKYGNNSTIIENLGLLSKITHIRHNVYLHFVDYILQENKINTWDLFIRVFYFNMPIIFLDYKYGRKRKELFDQMLEHVQNNVSIDNEFLAKAECQLNELALSGETNKNALEYLFSKDSKFISNAGIAKIIFDPKLLRKIGLDAELEKLRHSTLPAFTTPQDDDLWQFYQWKSIANRLLEANIGTEQALLIHDDINTDPKIKEVLAKALKK